MYYVEYKISGTMSVDANSPEEAEAIVSELCSEFGSLDEIECEISVLEEEV